MFARGPAIDDVILSGEGYFERTEEDERVRFGVAVKRHSIGGEWRRTRGCMAAEVALPARCADLVVVAREDPSEGGSDLDLPQSLVLTCGRPIVILPPQGASGPLRRILVAWNAGPEASRAVAGAMLPGRGRRGPVDDHRRRAGARTKPGAASPDISLVTARGPSCASCPLAPKA
jgi:hypothetical protein